MKKPSFSTYIRRYFFNGTIFIAAAKATFLEFIWVFGIVGGMFFFSYEIELFPKIVIFSIVGLIVFILQLTGGYLFIYLTLRNADKWHKFSELTESEQGKEIGGFIC